MAVSLVEMAGAIAVEQVVEAVMMLMSTATRASRSSTTAALTMDPSANLGTFR